ICTFDGELRIVAGSLRSAIIDALGSVETDASKPTKIARRLGLDKNLAWRVSRIASAGDPYSATQHIPGDAGVDILVRSLERGGADFRRLRAGALWTLFRVHAYQDDGSSIDSRGAGRETDPRSLLMPDFCTPTMPEIRTIKDDDGMIYELGDGPIGNAGAF